MRTATRPIPLLGSILLILAGCVQSNSGQAVQDRDTPGWTGRTVVPGSTSTIAGDAGATYLQQKWGVGRGR